MTSQVLPSSKPGKTERTNMFDNFLRNLPHNNVHFPSTRRYKFISSGGNGQIFENQVNKSYVKVGFNLNKNYHSMERVRRLFNNNPFTPQVLSRLYRENNNKKVKKKEGVVSMFKMERVPGKTLWNFEKNNPTSNQFNSIKVQLLNHVKKLRKRGIIHGDLNPRNIIIHKLPDGSLKVYIIDFGRSRSVYNNRRNTKINLVPWPTIIGCKPGQMRICALPYGRSNENFVRALFPNENVTNNTRLKNIFDILHQNRQEFVNINPNNNNKKYLIRFLEYFQNKDSRMKNLLNTIKRRERAYTMKHPGLPSLDNKKMPPYIKTQFINRLQKTGLLPKS